MNLAWAVALMMVFVAASGQARLLLRNGTVAPAIVGGYTPAAGSRPWMVSLRDSITKKHFCGAAHCLSNVDNGKWLANSQLTARVVVGGYPQSMQAPADFVRNVIAVRRHIKFNMGFTQDRFDNDVALLLLDKPIPPARLKTIILPNPQPSVEAIFSEGSVFLSAGWGYNNTQETTKPDKLQEIQMVLLSPNNCKTYFDGIPWTNDITKKTYTIRYNWSKNNLFCMRDAGKGGRPRIAVSLFPAPEGAFSDGFVHGGICRGDSGGPVFKDYGGGRAEQWGIVSFLKFPCGQDFSGYTDVAAQRNWIDDGILLLTRTTFVATFDSGMRSYYGFHRRLVYSPSAYLQHGYWFTLLKTGGTKGAELLASTALTSNVTLVQGRSVVIGPGVSVSFPNGKFRSLPVYWGQTLTFIIEQATMTLTVTQPFKFGQYEPYLSLRVEIKNPVPTGLSGMLASTVPASSQYVAPP
ncbi:hypothetical protein COHA_008297 [Chlorella ohadii]|uniref:Peptidase S1 domain-containing protein n=1 Tax=Chlorella ohadii TaxID=2649997 RepID=A0AAD5DJ43_9CHLO|nr:hypothetical protein COHA_008297 [Chlorella ohadii]